MAESRRVLVTGGCGYIGSHTLVKLVDEGFEAVVVDDLSNSCEIALDRVKKLCKHPDAITFHKVDMVDKEALEAVFKAHSPFCAAIHFAGLKAVGESVEKPLMYYRVNLSCAMNLVDMMQAYDCPRMIFSSSATVYGNSTPPYTEDSPAGAGLTNPYGETKYMQERIFDDVCRADQSLSVTLLRYFNPVGAHPSGMIGEDPQGIPNNLMPYIQQVATGRRKQLTVFGDDYDTKDGTGIRDFIHVEDLADAHVAALTHILTNGSGCRVFNVGTGNGHSVLEVVEAMRKASGKPINYTIGARREGDVAVSYAKTDLAEKELGWKARHTLPDMCRDAWNWATNNPMGYKDDTA